MIGTVINNFSQIKFWVKLIIIIIKRAANCEPEGGGHALKNFRIFNESSVIQLRDTRYSPKKKKFKEMI